MSDLCRDGARIYLSRKKTSGMNILIVSTSEKTGGAAVAANRLMEALNKNGERAHMLVRDKQTESITVSELPGRMFGRWHFLWERWCVFWGMRLSRDRLFEVDIANSGTDITRLPEFRRADVIHLHWVNQGMLSLSGIRKIVASGKPVIWTMHDLWPATAICHYARNCTAFVSGCRKCPMLPDSGSGNDLAYRVWRKKKSLYGSGNICFVACSRWLEGQARQSALLAGQRVMSIPNPIDQHVFCPQDKAAARMAVGLPADKRVVLFVSQRVTDSRKGMRFFAEAVSRLVAARPETRQDTVVAILGGHSDEMAERLDLPAYPLGYVSEESRIVQIYNSADVYVLPSLEDNLPNTIMESMACGVPCVGFRVGGIPEMIDHRRNGYVAELCDSVDLACGMRWTLFEADREQLSRAAVAKVWACYSQQSVALRYIEAYSECAALKQYII